MTTDEPPASAAGQSLENCPLCSSKLKGRKEDPQRACSNETGCGVKWQNPQNERWVIPA